MKIQVSSIDGLAAHYPKVYAKMLTCIFICPENKVIITIFFS